MLTAAETRTARETYKVPVSNLEALAERFKAIAKRAKRLGVTAPSFSLGATETKRWRDETGRKRETVYQEVTIFGETPVVPGGWTFLATLQHEAAGTIIHTIPGLATEGELARYRDSGPNCEHCNYDRRRKDTFIVRDPSGSLKKVGRTCLQDFTGGHDPHKAARLAELLGAAFSFGEFIEGDLGGRGARTMSVADLIAWSLAVSAEDGFLTRGKARNQGGIATADIAWNCAWNGIPKDRYGKPIYQAPSDADWAEAERLADKADTLLTDKGDDRGDYEHNLFVALAAGYAEERTIGLLASVIPFVQRAEARAAELALASVSSDHIGEAGQRLDATVTVTAAFLRDGMFGAQTLVKLATEDGARLTWWASGVAAAPGGGSLKAGTTKFHATFTVKKHGEFRGVKETTVNRVTLSEDIESFKEATRFGCPHCHAEPLTWCQTPKGKRANKLHGKRTKLNKLNAQGS